MYSFKLSVGKVGIAGTDLYTNEAIASFEPSRHLDLKFLYYSMSDYLLNNAKENIYGALLLNSELIKNSKILTPPRIEQKAIAEYLDKATAKIDRIIAIKQEQLESLQAHQDSKFTELLTLGLDSKASLINAEINWMDKMPKHWKRKRLKDVVFLKSGDSITSPSIDKIGTYPVFGGNGLRSFTESYTHEGYYPLMGRQGALCRNINYAEGKFYASEHAVVARPIQNCDILWIGELMKIMNLNQYSNAAAQPGLSVDRIKQLYIPVPPKEEQLLISKAIRAVQTRVSEGKKNIQSQIDTLQYYRKSLIHECVIGKKQVAEIHQPNLKAVKLYYPEIG